MALYTHLSKQQITKFASLFGLPAPSKTTGVLEGTVNTYYRLSYPGQNYFYLKIDETADLIRLKKELKVFRVLQKSGLSYEVAMPLLTTTGDFYVPFGKKFILFFKEVPGETLTAKTIGLKELKQIGEALGELHRLTHNILLPKHRFSVVGLRKVFKQIENKLALKHPELLPQIKKYLKYYAKKDSTKVPRGLIHADLFPENILAHNRKITGIIDFEAAGSGAFLFDICVCLHALCHNGKEFDVKKINVFLKSYQSQRKLTPEEKIAFEFYLNQSALRFLLTRLRDFELKDGPVKAKPFKDYRDFVRRFDEIKSLTIDQL